MISFTVKIVRMNKNEKEIFPWIHSFNEFSESAFKLAFQGGSSLRFQAPEDTNSNFFALDLCLFQGQMTSRDGLNFVLRRWGSEIVRASGPKISLPVIPWILANIGITSGEGGVLGGAQTFLSPFKDQMTHEIEVELYHGNRRNFHLTGRGVELEKTFYVWKMKIIFHIF